MKQLILPVVVTEDEDGYYIAEVLILPSCFTQGKTKEEALSNIKDVIYLCLEHMAEEGQMIADKYNLEQAEVAV